MPEEYAHARKKKLPLRLVNATSKTLAHQCVAPRTHHAQARQTRYIELLKETSEAIAHQKGAYFGPRIQAVKQPADHQLGIRAVHATLPEL